MSDTKNRFVALYLFLIFVGISALPGQLHALESKGLDQYNKLLQLINSEQGSLVEQEMAILSDTLDWKKAQQLSFKGNLRLLKNKASESAEGGLFFIRSLEGDLYILSKTKDTDLSYADLEAMIKNKLNFTIKTISAAYDDQVYKFARFVVVPTQSALDRIFKLSIIIMLFLVMVGMGLTLKLNDFAVVFSKPLGVITGEVLQFGIMPLIAVGLGYLMGFNSAYPYIFVGMVLITATPGGVTSNLMTHYAKGDVALSISLTSISTVLSIIFVPLLLNAYCANIPEVTIPVKTIVMTIIILVLIPLAIGMFVRAKWEELAKKSIKFFNILGITALLFLIVAGILSNLDKFGDTQRYGLLFYSMILILTLLGMFAGAVVAKVLGIKNYQVRAISLETGLRNSSLAMAIALLIQDSMGDFYSSLFWTSAMFGLAMYIAGFFSIKLYKLLLPVQEQA